MVRVYRYAKALLDYLFALIAAVLLLPIFILISIIIKMDSKGPVFFRQNRVGLYGEIFTIYKFRSMSVDTPNVSTDRLTDSHSYITRVGKILRKTSLDELPQLINVLKGDMSLIGPRPALYNQYELISSREELNVHSIKPGITGYAQVMGRDLITDTQKVQYDKHYVDNLSLTMDLKIVWFTVIAVFKADGIKA